MSNNETTATGWRLVPVEPTQEMLSAFICQQTAPAASPRETWAAMLSAAPQPPAAQMVNGLTEDETAVTAQVAGTLNGIRATMFHDEGAIAQCGSCGRYTLDPDALHQRFRLICECGDEHGWSGSFKKPGPDAKWHGAAPQPPAAQPATVKESLTHAEQQGNAVAIRSGMCQRCGKWAGAHATLPGQSTDHLCRCQPAAAPQPVAQGGYAPVTAEQEAATDSALGLVTLPPIRVDRATHAALQEAAKARGLILQALVRERLAPYALAAAPAGVVGEPVAWRDHVERRLWQWRQRTMNRSGDRLALDDFMDAASIDDLVDYVCDEWAAPPARQALTVAPLTEQWMALAWASAPDPLGLVFKDKDAALAFFRAVEKVFAAAWGLTLAGIGGKENANG